MSLASFVEETTTSIAGSSGDGAVTLTALSNTPRFSTVFGTSTRLVEYVIHDSTTGKLERGLGTVASNVLTRSVPLETWDGTTYDNTVPSAIQFGSSPSSGNVRIRMAPSVDMSVRNPHAMRRATSNVPFASGSYQYDPSGHWAFTANQASSAALAATTEYYAPFYIPQKGRLVGFGINIPASAVATAKVKMGLYEVGTDGLPGPCITRSNEIDISTTGLKTDETAGTWGGNAGPLTPGVGWFYVGWQFDIANVVMGRFGPSTQIMQTPAGLRDGYGPVNTLTKTAENSYATGLPTGTPSGSYTIVSSGATNGGLAPLLAVLNS